MMDVRKLAEAEKDLAKIDARSLAKTSPPGRDLAAKGMR